MMGNWTTYIFLVLAAVSLHAYLKNSDSMHKGLLQTWLIILFFHFITGLIHLTRPLQ